MSPNVLYVIPFATVPVRLIVGATCLMLVLVIFGWLLPHLLQFLRTSSTRTAMQNLVGVTIFVFSLFCLGVIPLIFLVASITNPKTYVTDSGITTESIARGKPISFAWSDIDSVTCTFTRDGLVTTLTILASDGREISFGNAGVFDLAPIHDLLQNQLGPLVVHRCHPAHRD